ncbi:hypothetical protein ACHAWF_005700 [Thalassiosira exigua]
MRCTTSPRRFLIPLAVLVATAASSVRAEGRREAGLGSPHRGEELVSLEPLTFGYVEPVQPDRDERGLLGDNNAADASSEESVDRSAAAAAPSGPEASELPDFEVMEGLDLFPGEDAFEDLELLSDADQDVYVDEEPEGWADEVEEDPASWPEGGDVEEWIEGEEGEEWHEGEPLDDEAGDYESTYVPDEEGQFVLAEEEEGEGYEEIDEPLIAEEGGPVNRRLRRVQSPVVFEGMDEERYLAEKKGFDDESRPMFEPALDENGEFEIEVEPEYLEELKAEGYDHGRKLQNGCASGQVRAKIQVITDNSPWENRIEIRRSNNALVAKLPAGNSKWASGKQYMGGVCLGAGTYKFIAIDSFRDGMCGRTTGRGLYRIYLNGAKRFTSPADCTANWGKRVHSYTVQRQNVNISRPNVQQQTQQAISSRGGCTNIRIQFKTDKFGGETVVKLVGNGRTHLISNKNVGAYQTKNMSKCVPPGTYTLQLQDQDGLCCKYGKGYYKLWANNRLLISGGFFVGSKSHRIRAGYNWKGTMNSRDNQWLNSHNSRRRKYNGGKGYVPMVWSSQLASDARSYAARLGGSCTALKHAVNIQHGENLARNTGTGSFAALRTTDQVMSRWVEREVNLSYPKNAHYTQVVWRGTKYVGCGEHSRNMGGGKMCRTQVCRYARPGNCNVRNGNWRAEAWKDDTGCGAACPSVGCY